MHNDNMLLPHRPSQHLHKATKTTVSEEDLADVVVEVVASTRPVQPARIAHASPSGRVAALNPRLP